MLQSWMMWNKGPVFAPDGDGTAAPVDGQSILYPDAAPAAVAAVADPAAPAGETPETWVEFAPDAAKTDAENATAKTAHDATKPADPVADPLDVVPADGVYALTLPDDMAIDTAMLEALSPAMKEAGITGKQANTLAAAMAKQRMGEVEAWGKTVTCWQASAKADAEIGGANWDTSVANATKVVNSYGTPELKQYLNETGAGNHPEVIRIMAKVGALIGEDKPTGTTQGGQARDAVSVLYPEDKVKG